MELKQLTNEEFINFINSFKPSTLYQTPEYAFTMNEENCSSIFLGMIDNNSIVAASLILIKKINGFKYAFAPRGFLINYNDPILLENYTTLLRKFLNKNGVVAIKISPLIIRNIYNSKGQLIGKNSNYGNIFNTLKKLGYYHLGYNNYFEAIKPRFEAVLDINKSPTELFKKIKKPFRTKIRKAEKDGIRVYHGGATDLDSLYNFTKDYYPRDLEYFKTLYNFFDKTGKVDLYYSMLDTTEYLKVSQRKYNEYQNKIAVINNELLKYKGTNQNIMNKKMELDKQFEIYQNQIVTATNYLRDNPNGILLSVTLVIKHMTEIYIINYGHDKRYNHFNGEHLLLWKLISRYSKMGYQKFNLGGVSNITLPKNKYKNLNEFKLGFNPNVIEYAGDFELITNSPLYFLYRRTSSSSNLLKNRSNSN